MQTHEWEALLDGWVHDRQSDTLLGSWVRSTQIRKQEKAAPAAVAEVIRLRRELEKLKGDLIYSAMCAKAQDESGAVQTTAAKRLTRILEGDPHE